MTRMEAGSVTSERNTNQDTDMTVDELRAYASSLTAMAEQLDEWCDEAECGENSHLRSARSHVRQARKLVFEALNFAELAMVRNLGRPTLARAGRAYQEKQESQV